MRDYITPHKADPDKMDVKAYPAVAKVELTMSTGHVYHIDVHTAGKNPALVSVDGAGYFWCSGDVAPNGDGALAFIQFVNAASAKESDQSPRTK